MKFDIVAFAKKVNLSYTAVKTHMDNGYCPWPRKIYRNQTKHPLYKTWEMMKIRCLNPKAKGYKHYGGRGIEVCAEWQISFEQFIKDMGNKPDNTTLDRINVNGNYEPINCRWATPKEQRENTRKGKGGIHFEKYSNKWRISWEGKEGKRYKDKIEAEQALSDLRKGYH